MLVSILDYCHGLVCIRNMLGETVIWNPLIRKYRILPTEPILKPSYSYKSSSYKSSSHAFGYDMCNDDYKVLRVTTFHNGGQPLNEFEVKVYSLRSHSWRKIEDRWPKKECTISSTSASLNGALHWLIAEGPVYDIYPLGPECLLAFDLATEKFRVFKTPVQQESELVTYLEVLKGQLCFIVSPDFETETGHDYNDVWLMKEYGEESSWTWIYKIVQRSVPWTFKYCKPLMFSENDKKVLLEMRQYNRKRQYNRTKLVWYDIEKKKGERVKIQKIPDSFETAICVGSLLLLDGDDVIDPAEQNNKRKR